MICIQNFYQNIKSKHYRIFRTLDTVVSDKMLNVSDGILYKINKNFHRKIIANLSMQYHGFKRMIAMDEFAERARRLKKYI